MSILIMDMKLPTEDILMILSPDGSVTFMDHTHKKMTEIEIPDDHGRLIDADEFCKKFGDWYTEEGPEEGFIGSVRQLMNMAPTVIPADKEGT